MTTLHTPAWSRPFFILSVQPSRQQHVMPLPPMALSRGEEEAAMRARDSCTNTARPTERQIWYKDTQRAARLLRDSYDAANATSHIRMRPLATSPTIHTNCGATYLASASTYYLLGILAEVRMSKSQEASGLH